MKIFCVVSARPNFMKIAPILEAFREFSEVQTRLVHMGQHYDDAMSGVFIRELGLPTPDFTLHCGGSGIRQTSEMMVEFEKVCAEERPDGVVVAGDVNGTFAAAFVASRLKIRVAHVEAGLRSFDRTMPEEINRIVVDQIADLHFCTERDAIDNLTREGVDPNRICMVGNVMIDSLMKGLQRAETSQILERLGVVERNYAVATLHRPRLVDDRDALCEILRALETIAREIPLVWPTHPRTRKNLAAFGIEERLLKTPNLRLVQPLGYLDFLKLVANARCVLTDSGGLQEETTALKVPCITIRENTERPVTCRVGTNQLAGLSAEGTLKAWERVRNGEYGERGTPELWDGRAAERIAREICARWGRGDVSP